MASPPIAAAIAFDFAEQIYATVAPPRTALAAASSFGFMLERHASLSAKRNASSGVKRSMPEAGSFGFRKTRGTFVTAMKTSARSAAAIAAAAKSAFTLYAWDLSGARANGARTGTKSASSNSREEPRVRGDDSPDVAEVVAAKRRRALGYERLTILTAEADRGYSEGECLAYDPFVDAAA